MTSFSFRKIPASRSAMVVMGMVFTIFVALSLAYDLRRIRHRAVFMSGYTAEIIAERGSSKKA